jgi:hypothetical protein
MPPLMEFLKIGSYPGRSYITANMPRGKFGLSLTRAQVGKSDESDDNDYRNLGACAIYSCSFMPCPEGISQSVIDE